MLLYGLFVQMESSESVGGVQSVVRSELVSVKTRSSFEFLTVLSSLPL